MDEQQEFRRFQMELEFVQCLCNLDYLHCDLHSDLANTGYLEDPQFVHYLDYLLYWKQDPYVKFLMYPFLSYPQALHFLSLLQTPDFRRNCKNLGFITFMHQNQFQHWRYRAQSAVLGQNS